MSTPRQTARVMGVTLQLSNPDATEQGWIGQDDILRQLLACWLVLDPAEGRFAEAVAAAEAGIAAIPRSRDLGGSKAERDWLEAVAREARRALAGP